MFYESRAPEKVKLSPDVVSFSAAMSACERGCLDLWLFLWRVLIQDSLKGRGVDMRQAQS